jgi:hypothetical protein
MALGWHRPGAAASRRSSRVRPGSVRRHLGPAGREPRESVTGPGSGRRWWAGGVQGRVRWGATEAKQGSGRGWLNRASEVGSCGGGDRRRHGRPEEPSAGWCAVGRRRRRQPGTGGGKAAVAAWVGRIRPYVNASSTHEWAGRAGVEKFPISDGPITFGGPIGKHYRKVVHFSATHLLWTVFPFNFRWP